MREIHLQIQRNLTVHYRKQTNKQTKEPKKRTTTTGSKNKTAAKIETDFKPSTGKIDDMLLRSVTQRTYSLDHAHTYTFTVCKHKSNRKRGPVKSRIR